MRTSTLLFSAIGLLIEPLNTRQGSFHQGVKDSNVHNDNITQAVWSHGFHQARALDTASRSMPAAYCRSWRTTHNPEVGEPCATSQS